MKKIIKEVNNYTLDNPSICRDNINAHLTIKLNDLYIAHLNKLKRKGKLPRHKQGYLECFEYKRTFTLPSNSPKKTYDGKEPYVNFERISITELVPKEYIESTHRALENFQKKHGKRDIFSFNHDVNSWFESFNSGYAFSNVMTFGIKNDSYLYKYIRSISFRYVNITDSFFMINISVYFSKELKELLSNYAVKDVKGTEKKYIFPNTSWYEYKRVGLSYENGTTVKSRNIEQIIEDVRWKVIQEICKYAKHCLFYNHKKIAPGLTVIDSNIDFKCNDEFWDSIGLNKYCYDQYKDTNLYLFIDDPENLCLLYNSCKDDTKLSETDLLSSDLDEYISNYVVAEKVDKLLRKGLKNYSKKISTIRLKSTRKWLKVKRDMDESLFYEVRFISEYSEPYIDPIFEHFESCRDKNKSQIVSAYNYMPKRIEKTKNLYNNIINLYKSNIDYKTAKTNDRLQRIAIIISIISIIISVVAIVHTPTANNKDTVMLGFSESLTKKQAETR